MREGKSRRLAYAIFFALLAALVVGFANPIGRLKADLRADAKGFVLSLEYGLRAVER